MEQNLVRVSFDLGLAKKITNKECEGRIITRNGRNARIICWDADRKDCIIALINTTSDGECLLTYKPDGSVNVGFDENANLILEIPEYLTFKDGDIIYCEVDNGGGDYCKWISILDGTVDTILSLNYHAYVSYIIDSSKDAGKLLIDDSSDNIGLIRLATDAERRKLINELNASDKPEAKKLLKRFFGIEKRPKYEFNPKDWVLCKSGDEWCLCRFSHKTLRFDGVLMYVTVGGIAYEKCIPYNEQTAQLLGTTDDWEPQP